MKKQTKKILGFAFLIVLLVGAFAYFGLNNSLSIFNSIGGPDHVKWEKISEDIYSYNYQYTITPSDPSGYKFGSTTNRFSFDVPVFSSDTFSLIPENINKNVQYISSHINYTLSSSVSNNNPLEVSINYTSKKVVCNYELSPGTNSRGDPISVTSGFPCEFSATLESSANLYGLTSLVALISVPKSGYQCGIYTLLDEGKECQNGLVTEKQISVYSLQNNACTLRQISEIQKTANDYETLADCQKNVILPPVKSQPAGWLSWIFRLNDIIQNFFSKIFGTLSIAGDTIVLPNTLHTYKINISTNNVDSNISDGFVSWQYASWIVLDRNNKTYLAGFWEDVDGLYLKNVTINTPSNVGDFVLWSMITEKNATWNRSIGAWTYGEEYPVIREFKSIKTEYSITTPMKPVATGWLAQVVAWFKDIWASIFGG